jgi:hypothetical protein
MIKFKAFDLFGIRPSLSIAEDSTYKTVIGSIMSLILISFSLGIGIFIIGKEMWERKNPRTNFFLESSFYPEGISYFTDIEVSLGIQNNLIKGQYFIDNTIYYVKGNMLIYNSTNQQNTVVDLNMEPCTSKSFSQEHLELFNLYPYNNTWCISRNQQINLTAIAIKNIILTDGAKQIQLKVFPCTNSTVSTSGVCKPLQVIEQYLNKTNLQMFVINNYIRTTNFSYPYSKYVEQYGFSVSMNSFSGYNLYVRNTEIIDDIGIMWKSQIFKKAYTHDSTILNPVANVNPNFAQVTFQMKNVKQYYERVYMKFQDVAAQLSGIITVIKFLTSCFLSSYYKFSFKKFVVKQLFNFKKEKTLLYIDRELKALESKVSYNNLQNMDKNSDRTIENTNNRILSKNI